MQDTLYYLPAEAHALGWQQQGLAQRLYHHLPPPDHLPLPMARDSGTTSTQASGVAHAAASCSITTRADNSSTFSHNVSPAAAAAWQGRRNADEKTRVHGMTQAFQLPAPFRERPRTGSRIFVQSHFPGIAGALASEMLSWQQDNRIRSSPCSSGKSAHTRICTHDGSMGLYQYCLKQFAKHAVKLSVVSCVKAMQQLSDASLSRQSVTNVLMLLRVQL